MLGREVVEAGEVVPVAGEGLGGLVLTPLVADRVRGDVREGSRSVLMVLYFFPPLDGVSMSRIRNVQHLPHH